MMHIGSLVLTCLACTGSAVHEWELTNAALYRAGNDIEIKIEELISRGFNKTEAKLESLLSYAVECAIMKVNGRVHKRSLGRRARPPYVYLNI